MHPGLISDLAIVTVVAAITGMLTRRIGQPSILGYLLAGLIVGPYIPIPLFADPHRMNELAEVGVVLVMFAVGLEFRVRRLVDILPVSGLTAFAQIASLAWAGFTVGWLLDWTTTASICLGATIAISSTMVVSAVLRTRQVDPDVRSHVFGVLVVQDVVAIALMAVVTGLASGQTIGLRPLGILIGQLTGVVTGLLVVGLLILPRVVRYAVRLDDSEVLVVLIAGAAFGLAMAAHLFGYSVALGAFIAGMSVAESGRGHEIEKALEPLRALFSAIFFVSIGMTVDPVVAWASLPLALALSAVVIGMQFLSVTTATVLSGSSLRLGIYSGLALGQIGELSFILAAIAIGGGVMPQETLPALVSVATVTTFTTPFLLNRAQFIVEAFDRGLPARGHQALAAYHAFIRETRSAGERESLRQPMLSVVLDWSALMVMFEIRHVVVVRIGAEYVWMANLGSALIAVPFTIGLVRSGRRFIALVRTHAQASTGPTTWTRAVEALALLAMVFSIGLPTLALMRPLVEGPWAEAGLLVAMLALLTSVGLRLGNRGSDQTSGVARLALELMQQASEDQRADQETSHMGIGPLAGLDYHLINVAQGSPADGLSLAQLDLRCRTGATIVAVCRGDSTITLPTGHDQLCANDVLAVSGSPEAIGRAREILEGEDESTHSQT